MKPLFFAATLLFCFSVCIAQDKPFYNEIEAFRQMDKENPPKSGSVIFVGSSSFRMWDELESTFSKYNAVNRGFGGSTFKEAIMYAEDLVLKYDPSAVFIYEGDNDVANGTPTDEIIRDAETFVNLIREKHPRVPIVFVSPKPSIARWNLKKNYEDLNAKLEEWSSHEPGTFYIDVWDHMLGEDGKPMPDIFIEDNLHMNEKGYKIWKKDIGGFLSMIIQ